MSVEKKIQDRAADMLFDLSKKVDERDAEIMRVYEIAAILATVAQAYLGSDPVAKNAEEQEALDAIIDAVYAVENGTTIEQAKLVRTESEEE